MNIRKKTACAAYKQFEEKNNSLPEVDPIELIKIRMVDFGYKANDLAREYGDKGTVRSLAVGTG